MYNKSEPNSKYTRRANSLGNPGDPPPLTKPTPPIRSNPGSATEQTNEMLNLVAQTETFATTKTYTYIITAEQHDK